MNHKLSHGILLSLLALVFTIGLTFASIELPGLLDAFLDRNIDTPDVATGLNELSDYKTELYLQYFHLRLIGYCCLALIIILIVVGFVTEKAGWTAAGALVLFLPVFGHFAATMFFLGGLGFLRLLWLPLLDVSFNLLRIGAIINLPYNILAYCCSLVGLNPWPNLSYFLTGIGLLIFFLGTLTWFYARMQKRGVADFWLYRLSRHPQYLGWIVWSYGMMFLPGSNIKLCYELSNSLPWLLSTMIIIGVAMLEELKMRRIQGEAYESYCRRTSFLVPLPRFVSKLFSAPLYLIFKKEYPERKREIFAMLVFYALFTIAISAFYSGFIPLSTKKVSQENVQQRIKELVKIVEEAKSGYERRQAIELLGAIGEPATESLTPFLKSEQDYIRWNVATALGNTKSDMVVDPLIKALYDENGNVRSSAAGALGKIGNKKAVQPLIEAFWDTKRNLPGAAAEALGEIGDQEAVPTLIRSLEDMEICPYNQVGWALWKLGSDRAVDAWIVGLKKGSWWYPRANCAAELGKNKLEKGMPALQEAVQDSSVEVRRAAVLALMEFQSEQTIETLREALKDKDFEVRMYAEEALKKISASNTKFRLRYSLK